jgi:hypothetical protein
VAAKTTLRVATEADAKRAKPKTLAEAVEGDDYLEILIAQRRVMIRDVAEVGGPAKAALHRQIALHSKEIAGLQAAAAEEAAEDAEAADEPFDSEAL